MMNLTREEIYSAVKEGVKEAFLIILDSGAGIGESIRDGVYYSMPTSDEIARQIYNGVEKSMPYPSDILNAFEESAKNIRNEKRRLNKEFLNLR